MDPSGYAERLASRIVEILASKRDELGLSLRQIEEKSGVNYRTVKRVLDGTRDMRLDDFQAISNALGLSAWRVVKQAEIDLETLETNQSASALTRAGQKREANIFFDGVAGNDGNAGNPAGSVEVYGLEPPSVDDLGVAAKRGSADPYEDIGEESQEGSREEW